MTSLASSRVSVDDDPQRIFEYFDEKGYTDGLPIIPPTEARVREMLTGTRRRPDESLGNMPPANYPATIEKIAVNAVMAGCKPEYMPVLVAAVELMLEPAWMLDALQSTTNPLTPMLIVNGPERRRIGLNCGTGVMGPGWRANATIGRAIRLILLNIGGAKPGNVDKCTQGFVGKYTLCIGENEEESAWPPFHTTRGFKAEESVVTVVGVNASTNIHDSTDRCEDLVKTLTASLVSPGTANVADPHSTPVIALNPLHVSILSNAGYSRERLQQHIFERCRLPADGLSVRRAVLRKGEHGDAHFLVDNAIPFTNKAEQILIVTTGGMGGGQSCYLPNGHYGVAASKRIDAPSRARLSNFNILPELRFSMPDPFAVDKASTAVLSMDFQNEIVEMLPEPARAVLDNAAAVLAKAREAGVTVIHIVVRFRDGYPEISPRNKTFSGLKAANRLREGTPGADLHPRVAAAPGEQVVTKRRVGAFSTTELATLLRAKGIENLVLLGIVTSGVVLSTVRWAADMDYSLVVVADACADRNEDVHRMLVEKVFPAQATVITTQALLAAL